MDALTEQQRCYVQAWNDTENGFNKILFDITTDDLKAIAGFVDLTKNYVWWNEEVQIYNCVLNSIRHDEHFMILLEADSGMNLEVSEEHNKRWHQAIKTNDRGLIKKLVEHKRFSYPGTGSFNEYYYKWYELTPMNYLVRDENFIEFVDTIRYAYNIMTADDKNKLIADLFCAININKKYNLVDECLKLFTS